MDKFGSYGNKAMNYRSVADLNSDIKQWIPELPNDLDLIVGVPRSGLFVANLLGLYLNLPVTDVEGFCEGRIFQAGPRLDSAEISDLSTGHKVLVVDDSIYSGAQMKQVRSRLENALLHQIYYAAVYVSPQGHRYVDFWYEVVDLPRVFEWNVMHHGVLANSCVDIDGVLCRNPTKRENDDGENYRRFLTNVKPSTVPTKTIGWLVTCRLEKYRKLTEEWLRKHNIRYEYLIMMDLPDKETRVALGSHGSFKAQAYKSIDATLFIESSYRQAQEIVRLAGKPVLCTEIGQMINPSYLTASHNRGRKFINEVVDNPLRAFLKLARFLKARFRIIELKVMARIREKKIKKKINEIK